MEYAGLSPEEFAEQRVWVVDRNRKGVKLMPNPMQILHQKNKDKAVKQGKPPHFLTLKSRRVGITTWEQMISYKYVTTISNSNCLTVGHTIPDTKTIFKMVGKMAMMDPERPDGLDDTNMFIENKSIGSTFSIGTAGSKGLKRGDRLDRFHGSEVAFWPGKFEDIDNLIYGLAQALEGEMNLESTGNGAQGWFYETWKDAIKGTNDYTPLFYPWFINPLNVLNSTKLRKEDYLDTITSEDKEVMKKYKLTFSQMLWRRSKMKKSKKLFPQEYPSNWMEAFLVRGSIFFSEWDFGKLERNCRKPINETEGTVTWENPQKKTEYVIGADTSGGEVDSDFCCGGVLNKRTGNQAALLRGKWPPHIFAKKLVDLAIKYNDAILAIESNYHGASVLNTAMNTLSYQHLYYHEKVLDKGRKGLKPTERIVGWHTNGKTRPILLDDLAEAVQEGWIQVNDPFLISEGRTFVDKGGKYEAEQGEHDDSIFAWGIAYQARKQRKVQWIYT